jgi:hypothetical protein
MTLYDSFVNREHPPAIQRLMVKLNGNIVRVIRRWLNKKDGPISVLEIGPGQGYFYRACMNDEQIQYYALDRNALALHSLKQLPEAHKIHGELPNPGDLGRRFDCNYAAFVLEHLQNGGEAQYEFMRWALQHVLPNGLIVLQLPNCEKLGFEFWNIDYTHTFPTTKRSIAHLMGDAGIDDIAMYDVSGLLTHKYFTNRYIHLLQRVLLWFYNYKLFDALGYYLLGRPPWRHGTLFYSAYAFCKGQHFFVVARPPNT